MLKKVLCIVVLAVAFCFVLASCDDDLGETCLCLNHTEATCTEDGYCLDCGSIVEWATGHDSEEVSSTYNCILGGSTKYVCSVCGEENSYDRAGRGEHYFPSYSYETIEAPTCTKEGKSQCVCYYCDEIDIKTLSAKHNYVSGVCEDCSKCIVEIKLPKTPITVHDYSYNGSIDETCKITSLAIKEIEKNYYDSNYDITFVWAGEKTYDNDGNNYSSSVGFAYKLYDSDGYVVYSSSTYSTSVAVGEKFKDQGFIAYDVNLDLSETYTMEILNLD